MRTQSLVIIVEPSEAFSSSHPPDPDVLSVRAVLLKIARKNIYHRMPCSLLQ